MGNTKSSKNILKCIIAVLLIVFIVAGVGLGLTLWDKFSGKYSSQNPNDEVMVFDGVEYVPNENVETFLVLGLDKFEGDLSNNSYNNDQQADFLMLLVFDNDAKTWSAININRDTMVEMNVLGVAGDKVGTVTKQIALAHTYGSGENVSCQNTAEAVSKLLCGVRVNHYISLTLDSVAVLNDIVNGVEVEVLDDFTGIDNTLKKGETVTLKGQQALTYVRTRYGLEDSANSTRMKRQKQYLDALYKKIVEFSEKDEKFVVNASVKMAEYMVSDRSVNQLQKIAQKCVEYTKGDVYTIEGENKMGAEFVEFYPDEDSVKKTVVDLFYKPKS